jgi:hypothetical protein
MKGYLKYVLIMSMALGCKDPFSPPVTDDQVSFLTVDGRLDGTTGTATVKLYRAIKLSSAESFPVVSDAAVVLEEQNGNTYSLPYQGEGIYQQSQLPFSQAIKYRIKITDLSGKIYSSDFVPMLQTPAIDTLKWIPSSEGVSFLVSSVKQNDASRFYQWTFDETWEYVSDNASILKIVNNIPIERPESEQIYKCWKSSPSKEILIKSTDLFSDNQVNDFQVAFLPAGSQKLTRDYSINLRQMSITEEAYNYWDQVKKSSQGTGGLFDPLPAQVTGNVRCETDPNETVLGYFSASFTITKRIFVTYKELPNSLQILTPMNCKINEVPFSEFNSHYDSTLVIISTYGVTVTLGYIFSTKICVDCRAQGGVTVKPLFWNY